MQEQDTDGQTSTSSAPEIPNNDLLKEVSFSDSFGSRWRSLGKAAARVAAVTAGTVWGAEQYVKGEAVGSESKDSPSESLVPLTSPEDIFYTIPNNWTEVLMQSNKHIEQGLEKFLGSLKYSDGFVAVENFTKAIKNDGTEIRLTADVYLTPEFFERFKIEGQDKFKLGQVCTTVNLKGESSVSFNGQTNAVEAISTALSKVLEGKSVRVAGAAEQELSLEIAEARFDGKRIILKGPVKYTVKDTEITATLTAELPLDGGRPKFDLKVDEETLKAAGEAVLDELKDSPEWKKVEASTEDFIKKHAGEFLNPLKALEGYLTIENIDKDLDKDRRELTVNADVYVLPKFFEMMKIKVNEKVKLGEISVELDEKGRSTARFQGSIDKNEAIAKALSFALEGKTLEVDIGTDEPVTFQVHSVDYDGKVITLQGPTTYTSGKNHISATLRVELNVKNGKVKCDVKVDEDSLKAMAAAYLNDMIPNTPLGKITVNPDPNGKGAVVNAKLNFYGMQGEVSNILVTHSGKVDTSKASVTLGASVAVSFGYFMISQVHGGYDLNTKDLTLGGALTLSGDTTGFLFCVEGEAVISLKDPTKLTARGDLSILTLPAGWSETTLDLKSGKLETAMKIGNGNTKIDGHAVIQAPVNGVPWKIEVDKADVEMVGFKLSKGRLLIDDSGMNMSVDVQLLGGKASAEFHSDNGLKKPHINLSQDLHVGVDLGQFGKHGLTAKLSLEAKNSGVKGTLTADSKFGSVSIDIDSRSLNDLSLSDLEKRLTKELMKVAKDWDKKIAEALKKAEEEVRKQAEAAAEEAKRVAKQAEDAAIAAREEAKRAAAQAKKAEEEARKLGEKAGKEIEKLKPKKPKIKIRKPKVKISKPKVRIGKPKW